MLESGLRQNQYRTFGSRALHTLFRHLDNLIQVLLYQLKSSQFLLLIFLDRLRRDQLLRHTTIDEHVILLGDFHAALFGVELTDAQVIAHFLQIKLLRLVPREIHHVQPRYVRIFAVRLENSGRALEQSLKSLQEEGSHWASTQVAGQALMTLENGIVVTHYSEDGWESVIGAEEVDIDA